MKYCFLFALAVMSAQAQVPDLGGDGVWLPRPVADLAPNADVPFQPWAKLKFQENRATKQNASDPAACRPAFRESCSCRVLSRSFKRPTESCSCMKAARMSGVRCGWMAVASRKTRIPIGWAIPLATGRETRLVVDSIGFNDQTWLDDAGHPHTEQLHVIEKFTRTDAQTMKYEVVIDDPGAYSHTWTSSSSLSFRRGEKLAEDICLDKISK